MKMKKKMPNKKTNNKMMMKKPMPGMSKAEHNKMMKTKMGKY